MTWKNNSRKMVTLTRDLVFSWYLTEGTLTMINGIVYLTTKQIYKVQIKNFEIRGPK